ncbi:MAG TPA: LysM peptidoglycan-binding domain-containing protein [Anaerolineales bacterium]|nr:LysM peptidoglycan-binding domain-containing protein [Anaerolineales bacterium]
MKNVWSLLRGVLIALASIGLLFGGFSLSMAEGGLAKPVPPYVQPTNLPPTQQQPPTFVPTSGSSSLPSADTSTPILLPATATATLPPPPTNCPPPSGWIPYQVQPGDTLNTLSSLYGVTVAQLAQANCLLAYSLLPGVLIYVPPVATPTTIPCKPPQNWLIYTVQTGDTLYRLSQAFGVTVAQLQQANCMGNSSLLRPGQKLYVPPWGTRTPSPTITVTPSLTRTPTNTPTRTATVPVPTTVVPSDTPTDTLQPADTETPTEMPTDTETAPPSGY